MTDFRVKTATAIVLGNSATHAPGATAQNNLGDDTDQLDLTSLGAGAYRQCTKFDFGTPRGRAWRVTACIEPSTTPTAGEVVDFYIAYSSSSTAGQDNPGGVAGTDGAYVGYNAAASDADEAIEQLQYIGSLIATADNEWQVSEIGVIVNPLQYGTIVVANRLAAALVADAVEMSIRLSPIVDTDA